MALSKEQCAEKVKLCYEHNSPQTFIRMISMRKSYPELQFKPYKMHMHILVKKFEKTGSIEDGRRTNERLKSARTPAVFTKVKDMFAETPQMSIRKLANSITENASITSVYPMLRFDSKLTTYTISIMQHIKHSDIDYRIQFERWMIEHDTIIEHVWFSDEAYFYLNGDVNNGFAFC